MSDDRDGRGDEPRTARGSDAPIVLGTEPDETFEFEPRVEDLPRGTTLGRYVILGRIGEGGAGVIYAAFDPDLDRKVAIKLLRVVEGSSDRGEVRRARLLREAQAIAKVTHPAVVAVHDVGTFAAGVFVAMEFVDGITLRRWMEARDEPFPWREVIRVFREAGRGLAAAHAAGVIHRDFKPDNVILGSDGRICVLDFGLARLTDEPEDEEELAEIRDCYPGSLSTGESDGELTRAGSVLGTPAYMSPEQHVGQTADERSDQFGFCVALYEALFGERPFTGNRRVAIAVEVMKGRVRPAPPGSEVPAWLRAVVLRGLSSRAADRFPSMEALLRELDRDPAASRRRWLRGSGLLAVAGAAALAMAWQLDREAGLCTGGEDKLAGVWDDAQRQQLQARFAASGRPFASDAWAGVADSVDGWVAQWLELHVEACEATRVRGEASEVLLDQRMACLDVRLGELAALGRVLQRLPAELLDRAPAAAAALNSPRMCTNDDGLRAVVPAPEGMSEAVARLRAEHDEAWIALRAGDYRDARTRSESLARELEAVHYPPLRASVLLLLGNVQSTLGEYAEAERTLHDAAAEASRAGFDRVLATAWLDLVTVVEQQGARHDEAERWARYAESVIDRLPEDRLRTNLLMARGDVARNAGRAGDALAYYHEALALEERRVGPRNRDVTRVLTSLAILLATKGELASAEGYFQRALDIDRDALGPNHPTVANDLMNLGNVQYSQDRLDDAAANYDRALQIQTKVFAEDSSTVATTLINLGNVLREKSDHGAAVDAYTRALAGLERAHGSEHPKVAYALHGLGSARLDLGQPDRARESLERAVAIRQKDKSDPTNLAESQAALARALWSLGTDRDRAIDLALAARETYAKAGVKESERLAALDAWLAERKAG
jgi:tetratricopeptide (TPR) repeat protein